MNQTQLKKRLSLAVLLASAISLQYGCDNDAKATTPSANSTPAATSTQTAAKADGSITEADYLKAAKEAYPYATQKEFDERVANDKTLSICNATKDNPSAEQAQEIMTFEQARIQYPTDNKLYGDWKKGKEWVEGTHGGRLGFTDYDDPHHPNGANCYACHAIAPDFPAGNMGPSLTSYGMRGNSPEIIKYTYDKIYSSKALNPCSLMPRYGGEGHLITPEQVADIVAFLIDPASPVNTPVKTQ